jgi:predicted SnoaL-like aldol condensation-catalyzing enzyme
MKKSLSTIAKTAATAAALITATACTTSPSNSDSNAELSNQDKAIALLNSIETGDQQAVNYVNPEQYTQHNLAVADGLAGFGAVLQALPKDSAKVNVVRAFSDGDYVFSHTDYNFFGPKVGFDIFRFEDGLIVEHWDNLTVKADTPNPSNRTQLDGTTVLADLDKTAENKALVSDFVDSILVKGEMDKLTTFIDGENYLQHNTQIADGLSGLAAAFEGMAQQGISMIYTENHIVLGEGNFVLSVSEGTFADAPTSFYDLFRVEGGKIVEHWDVIETIPAQDEWKNSNGKFGNL